MEEKHLLYASLIVGMAGLIALYLISENAALPDFENGNLSSMVGKEVRVSGEMLAITQTEKYARITLRESKYGREVPVVVFKQSSEPLTLEPGDMLEVTGEIGKGSRGMEIMGNRIEKKN